MTSFKLVSKIDALLEKEEGYQFKFFHNKIRCCLVYPNIYFVGMSNLGYQTIYHLLNSTGFATSERAFLPETSDIEEYKRTNTPIFSLETKTPISEFDILFFSISYEPDFLNVLKILNLSKIPLLAEDRNKKFPLIGSGGITTMINIEPLCNFIDFFVIGEGEEIIKDVIEIYKENSTSSKEKILKELDKIEGIYVPSFYSIKYNSDNKIEKISPKSFAKKIIKKNFVKDLNKYPAYSIISTPNTVFKNCFLVEITRGCPKSCRFCVVPNCYFPYRIKDVKSIISVCKKNIRENLSIGLVSANLSSYKYFNKLISSLIKDIKDTPLQFPSLGMDILKNQDVELLKNIKQDNLTFALEVGSKKLQNIINKKIDIELFKKFIKQLNFLKQIKFYFLVGLPYEQENDIYSLINLVTILRNEIPDNIKVVLSISCFVPKPRTPFQWHVMENIKTLKQKINFIRRNVTKYSIKVDFESLKNSQIEYFLSFGNRKTGKLLSNIVNYNAKFSQNNFPEIYRDKEKNEIFPWDIIDIGIKSENLYKEFCRI